MQKKYIGSTKLLYNFLKWNKKFPYLKINNLHYTIFPCFLGHKFFVYNGKTYKILTISTKDMLYHKFGEFVNTRKSHVFSKK